MLNEDIIITNFLIANFEKSRRLEDYVSERDFEETPISYTELVNVLYDVFGFEKDIIESVLRKWLRTLNIDVERYENISKLSTNMEEILVEELTETINKEINKEILANIFRLSGSTNPLV